MKEKIELFLKLSKIFSSHNFHLYLVGGTVRDFLYKKEFDDIDLVTDASPDEVMKLLPSVDTTFAKYGAFKYVENDNKCDIVCFRIEKGYKDSRHPTIIKFTNDIKKDVKRRDFTINGLYMDDRFQVIDLVKGQRDLKNHIIRFIGIPYLRIKQDPLRILRGIRFSLMLGFDIDKRTSKAFKRYAKLLDKLNPNKIKEERNKITGVDEETIKNKFNEFNVIKYF